MPSELFVEICKIEKLDNHPNADRLEIATVKGWQCIVQKDIYSIGDKVIYFPIDSILPPNVEEKIFGPDSKVKLTKSRVKTIKLRGIISQGLVVPITVFEIDNSTPTGTNVKEMLGITKYEIKQKVPNIMSGKTTGKRSENINFSKYTSINHLKNFPTFLDNKEVCVREKIHGTNFRASILKRTPHTLFQKIKDWLERKILFQDNEYEFCYGSHNVQLKKADKKGGFYPKNVYWEMVEKYSIENLIKNIKKKYPDWNNIILYGEVYGDGIQKNYSYGCIKDEKKLVIFDIKVDDEYLGENDLERICKEFNLEMAPIIYKGIYDIDKITELNTGNSVMVPEQKIIEGVIIRTILDKNRDIFKFINPEYLLGKNNTEWT